MKAAEAEKVLALEGKIQALQADVEKVPSLYYDIYSQ